MKEDDDFSRYFGDALEGRYDCVDRIVLTDISRGATAEAVSALGGAI